MTAHDPRVTLTEADEELLGPFIWGGWIGVAEGKRDAFSRELRATVEQIVAEHVAARLDEQVPEGWYVVTPHHYRSLNDRLDRVRAVAEQWDNGCARDVLAALDAPQDAPRGPVGAEQGAEVAGGQGDAASELRRLHRIGSTPVGQVSTEDAEFYESHPLRDVLGGHARDFRLMVAEWLETR